MTGSGPLVVSGGITCLQATIVRTCGISSGIIWNPNSHRVLCNFGREAEPWWKANERETRARYRHWGAEGGRRHLGSVSLSRREGRCSVGGFSVALGRAGGNCWLCQSSLGCSAHPLGSHHVSRKHSDCVLQHLGPEAASATA